MPYASTTMRARAMFSIAVNRSSERLAVTRTAANYVPGTS